MKMSKEEKAKRTKAYKLANPAKVKVVNKAWYEKNRAHATKMSNAYYRANPEKRKAWLLAHPGYSGKRHVARKEKEAGRKKPNRCEVCGSTKKISFDHCHKAKKFRGWVCHNCNIILGYAKDRPLVLRKLAVYLENFAARLKLEKQNSAKTIVTTKKKGSK